jgi:hypothetical protein
MHNHHGWFYAFRNRSAADVLDLEMARELGHGRRMLCLESFGTIACEHFGAKKPAFLNLSNGHQNGE